MVYNNSAGVPYPWAQPYPGSAKSEDASATPPEANPADLKKEGELRLKYANGKKLDAHERDFLRFFNPELLNTMRLIDHEQRLYENTIKRCHCKKHRKQISFYKTMSVLSSANLKGQGIFGPDSNNTMIRVRALQKIDRLTRGRRF